MGDGRCAANTRSSSSVAHRPSSVARRPSETRPCNIRSRLESHGTREGDGLVLIHSVAAHPDASDEHAVLVQRNAARKGDDSVAEFLTPADADLVRVADAPERATGL